MSDSGDEREQEEEQELDLSNSDVVTKYKAAAEITNSALAAVIKDAVPGARVVDLCRRGDSIIEEAVAKVFKGKLGQEKSKIEKGVAFPTCCSLNNVVGHFSPLETDTTTLKEGDVLKIDLGTHIDGYIACAAHTLVVQEEAQAPVTGRAADLLAATSVALEAAMRLIRPGKRIADVSPILQRVVEAYGCNLVEGVLSHQLKQFIIDANKCVLNKPSPEAKVDDGEFEENEAWGIDIVVSTGEGKSRVLDEKETMVYKRALDQNYSLKMKASRSIFSEVQKRFTFMPFTMRAFEDKKARLGLVECISHGLLHPYPVLHEKAGELVAQLKATVLLMPNGSDRITSAALQTFDTEKKITDVDILKLLQSSLKSKKKNKGKKKGKGPSEQDDDAAVVAVDADK